MKFQKGFEYYTTCNMCIQCPQPRARRGHRTFWNLSYRQCDPPWGCWELNLGLRQEQHVHLTTKPSLQSLDSNPYGHVAEKRHESPHPEQMMLHLDIILRSPCQVLRLTHRDRITITKACESVVMRRAKRARWVGHLPHEQEELSSVPTHVKSCARLCTRLQLQHYERQRVTEACWLPVWLQGHQRDPSLKRRRQTVIGQDTPNHLVLHPHAHMCASTSQPAYMARSYSQTIVISFKAVMVA